MAKEIKNETANNAAEAAVETKEETVMDNNTVEQQAQPVAAPVATTEAGAQVPAAVPQTFAEKHPKISAFGKKVWGVGKWVLGGAALVGLAIGAEKIGEGIGFDKATDAYDKLSGGNSDPDPDDYDPDDDLGDEGIEEVNEN